MTWHIHHGTGYLLCFDVPFGHAKHYQHTDLPARLAEHQTGRGARLLQVAKDAGITWTLARTWPGDRRRERQLKNQGRRVTPLPRMRHHAPHTRRRARGQTGMGKRQERLAEPEPGTSPPEYVIVTWVSEQLRDRIQSNGKSLYEVLHPYDPQVRAPEPELEAEP